MPASHSRSDAGRSLLGAICDIVVLHHYHRLSPHCSCQLQVRDGGGHSGAHAEQEDRAGPSWRMPPEADGGLGSPPPALPPAFPAVMEVCRPRWPVMVDTIQ